MVPADNKWFTRLVVASAIRDALEEMKLSLPTVDDEKRKELEAARAVLEGNNPVDACARDVKTREERSSR